MNLSRVGFTLLTKLHSSVEPITTPTFIFDLIHHMPNGPMTSFMVLYSSAKFTHHWNCLKRYKYFQVHNI